MPSRWQSNDGGHGALSHAAALAPATPLWQRVPIRDDDGAPLSDFMMLIPGLRQRPSAEQGRLLARVDDVLRIHRHVVVFAECNLKLNLLWISVRAVPGICRDLADALTEAVPEARLVAPEGPATYRSRGDT